MLREGHKRQEKTRAVSGGCCRLHGGGLGLTTEAQPSCTCGLPRALHFHMPTRPFSWESPRVCAHPPWPITGVIFTCCWMLSPDFRLA